MGNCQNYGPFLGPYYNTGPNTGPNLGTQKGTIILTVPHIQISTGRASAAPALKPKPARQLSGTIYRDLSPTLGFCLGTPRLRVYTPMQYSLYTPTLKGTLILVDLHLVGWMALSQRSESR